MRSTSNITSFFLLLLMVSLPISKGVASVALVGLLLTALLSFQQVKLKRTDWYLLPLMLVWLLLLISQIYSDNIDLGWDILYRQNAMLLMPPIYLIHRTIIHQRFVLYLTTFVIAVLFAAALTLFFYFIPESTTIAITSKLTLLQEHIAHEKQDAFGAYSPFLDRLHFSYLIGIAILTLLWRIFKSPTQLTWQLSVLGLLIATMLLLGARGGQLGFLVIAAVWSIFLYLQFLHPTLKVKIGQIGSIIVLIAGISIGATALPYVAYKYVPAVQVRYNQLKWEIETFYNGTYVDFAYTHFTSIRRILSWQNTSQLVKEQPLLGTGVGDFDATLQAIYKRKDLGFPINAHQQFLYYWGAGGLLCFLSFLCAFFALWWSTLRIRHWQEKAVILSFSGFYLIVFMLDAPLSYQVGSMSFCWFYLLFAGMNNEIS